MVFFKVTKDRPGFLNVGRSGVDELSGVLGDRSDQALGLQVSEGGPRQGSVDSKPVTENAWSNHLHLGHLHEHLVVSRLGVHDLVVDLLLSLSLGPLLLLTLRRVHGGLGLLLLWWHLVACLSSFSPTTIALSPC